MEEEKKQDDFLKSVFKNSELTPPPSDDFTEQVMLQAKVVHAKEVSQKATYNWLAKAAVGYLGWGMVILILWITGVLNQALEFGLNILQPVVDFTGAPILVGVIIYLILARLSFVVYIIYKFQNSGKPSLI